MRDVWHEREQAQRAQIIAALKPADAGRTADDVARECGVSKYTIYAGKATFIGMDANEAQKLRAHEGGDFKKGLSWDGCALARTKPANAGCAG